MTIRQMKSMSGWRRFVSDYGFEGICHSRNRERFHRWMLNTIGVSSGLFAGGVLLNRMGDPLDNNSLATFIVFPASTDSQRDVFQHGLKLCSENGANLDKLQSATNRLAPIQSRIAELCECVEKLREARGTHPTASISDLLQSIGTAGMGLPVRNAIKRLVSDAKNVEDLENLAYKRLVSGWTSAGYFDEATYRNRQIFGARQTSEAVGVDIGSQVCADLHKMSLSETLGAAVKSVQQWGFAVIKEAIPETRMQVLRNSLSLDEGSASKIGERIIAMDKNISHSRALPNRLQLLLRGSSLESLSGDIHGHILPIITALLDRKSSEPDRVILTDVRLIVVDCAAEKGNWTLMNPRGGYTVLVPLHDRDALSGSQLILPGSHFLADRSLPLYQKFYLAAQRYATVKRPLAVTELFEDGCWRAGDALIMDNRLLHRSQGNQRFKSGTYLLMKYETADEAPVGLYFTGKLTYRLAALLETTAHWSIPIA